MESISRQDQITSLELLIDDCMRSQKKGLHFIVTSIVIWTLIFIVQLLPISVMQKNLLTFCSSAFLMPLAVMFSKIFGIKFSDNSNPLNGLGLIFTLNQMLYLLIVMWVFNAKPEYMVMVYAMVFGAHLLPYSWIYRSKAYRIVSIAGTLGALICGIFAGSVYVALFMVVLEVVFTLLLCFELKNVK